jgi:hypothetical protein
MATITPDPEKIEIIPPPKPKEIERWWKSKLAKIGITSFTLGGIKTAVDIVQWLLDLRGRGQEAMNWMHELSDILHHMPHIPEWVNGVLLAVGVGVLLWDNGRRHKLRSSSGAQTERLLKEPIEQSREPSPQPLNAPSIVLEYYWRDSNDSGHTDSINMPLQFKNVGKDIAVNVELEVRYLKWIAKFPMIPHLAAGDSKSLLVNLDYDGYDLAGLGADHQFISVIKPPGDDALKQSRMVPAVVKYRDIHGTDFVSEYEFRWNHEKREATALFVRYGRPLLTQGKTEMPALRPKVVPVRFIKPPTQTFAGLMIANDGEPAYDVSISPVQIGTSTLEIEGGYPRLIKNEGEQYCRVWIRKENRGVATGNDLLSEFVSQGLTEISLIIRYKDGDNRWYVTECKLERDVLTSNGIAVKYVSQKLSEQSKPQIENGAMSAGPAPDVALVWDWTEDQKKMRGLSETGKTILVHNRSPHQWIYNVQIHPIEMGQKLEFERINEIAPGKLHEILARWGNSSSLTRDIAEFFTAPINEREAQRKGWHYTKMHNRGLSPYFLKIPVRVTYKDKNNKEWEHKTTFVFDIGLESFFERD